MKALPVLDPQSSAVNNLPKRNLLCSYKGGKLLVRDNVVRSPIYQHDNILNEPNK